MWVTEAGYERVEAPAVPVWQIKAAVKVVVCLRVCVCMCSCGSDSTDFDFREEGTCVRNLICEGVNITITICLQRN